MIIANPIYDSVFKYLLEDIDIAKELLSTIIGQEIVSISVQPQETTAEIDSHVLTIFRLDFKAVIKTQDNQYKKVLIELQKAKKLFDIMRFRRYLGENYQKTDTIQHEKKGDMNVPLNIITIYFLGFNLEKGYPPVFKSTPQISDVVTGAILSNLPKEPFVELLNHTSYTIQIPTLSNILQTKVEKVLMIFSPKYKTDDRHKLDYIGKIDDQLIHKILNRLVRAVADEQVRKNMDFEDEIENTIANLLREKDEIIEEAVKQLDEKAKTIEENEKTIEENEKTIEEKEKTIEEKEKMLAQQAALIEELKHKLANKKD